MKIKHKANKKKRTFLKFRYLSLKFINFSSIFHYQD